MIVTKLVIVITGEREIHLWHNKHLSAGALIEKAAQGWNSLLSLNLAIFQRRYSLCVEILTKFFQESTHHN